MYLKWLFAVAVLAVTHSAMTLETARMELPDGFEARSERIAIVGYGGRNRGEYRLGPYSGQFKRIETRWAIADPFFAAKRGDSSFTIAGPGLQSQVSAVCGMKENTVTIGIVTFDPKKMSYQCTFESDGAVMDARFVLGQPKPDNARQRLLAWAVRAGEADIGNVRLTIRSVHKYDGSKIQSPTPVGYLLSEADRPVGAIELTDVNPTLFLPAGDDDKAASLRVAALLAGMALSVLRDPADSMLGDN